MTRINVGVDPKELPDKLLLAEHREITRIPNTVRYRQARIDDLPLQFTLGTGHVRFFYDKLLYLANRYTSLRDECIQRGFNITDKSSAFDCLPSDLLNDYRPTLHDRILIVTRIRSKGHELRLLKS